MIAKLLPQSQHEHRERGGMDLGIFIFETLWCGTWGREFVVALALVGNGWGWMTLNIFSNPNNSEFPGVCKHQWLWQGPGIKAVLRIIHEKVLRGMKSIHWTNLIIPLLFPVFLHQHRQQMKLSGWNYEDNEFLVQSLSTEGLFSAFPDIFCTRKEGLHTSGRRGEEQGSNTLRIENRSLI